MLETTGVREPRAPDEVLHPGTRAIFRYWEAIRGEAAAPGREALDLRALRNYVPWLFIAERDDRNHSYSWRLAGTKVCALWRRQLTGVDLFAGWDRFERDTTRRLLDGVTHSLQPCALRLRLTTSLDQTIGIELIGLPLRARLGDAVHVFGAIMPFCEIDMLRYDRIVSVELSAARSIWTEPLPGDGRVPSRPPLLVIEGGRGRG